MCRLGDPAIAPSADRGRSGRRAWRAAYPASTAFDLPLDGQSWMDYIAARGYDVYLLDIRGYGKSKPAEGDVRGPEGQSAGVRSDTAIKDIGTVVDFILSRRYSLAST